MDPFVIDTSHDTGYIAADSLAGGRNNTPIRITPSTVSSLTQQFIDDEQITDVRDALRFTPNVVPVDWNGGHTGGGDVFNSWSYNIRGAGVGPQGGNPPTVNYFPFYGVKDLFNVDRVEVDRGPNSILFGVGNLGGSVSTYTRDARFDKSFENLDVSVNSYGGVRVTADVNQMITKDIAVRFDALADNDQGWRKGDDTKKWGGYLANEWKPTDDTSLRVNLEAYKQETPQFSMNLTDNYSQWDHQTASQTWGATPSGGTAQFNSQGEWGGASTKVWIPENQTLMNWGSGFRGAGLSDGPYYINAVMRPSSYVLAGTNGLAVPALPDRDFTVGPSDGLFTWEYYTLTGYLDHTFNKNSEIELSAYRYADKGTAQNFESPTNAYVDINKQMPNGQANPFYGMIYSEMFLDKQIQDHSANEVRAQYNYHFDANVWGVPVKEWMSVSGGAEMHLLTARQYIATDMNGYDPNNWTANMIWAREYWNDPHASISLPSTINGDTIRYLPLPFNWFDHDLTEQIKYGGAVSQTRLWDDRLSVTLGARHDEYYSNLENVRGTGNIPALENDKGTTYSAGIVGYVLPWLGVVYNFSENFAPIGGGVAPSLGGDEFGPATGKSNSAGIRISTNDGKYYITADYYVDKAHGRISNDSIPMQNIWNDYLGAGGSATDIGPAGTITGTGLTAHAVMSYADTEDVKDDGVEIEATANPTQNWRLQAAFSVPKSVSDNDLPGSRAYFASHLSEWQKALGITTGPSTVVQNSNQLAQDLASSELTLANTSATPENQGVVKYTASAQVVYHFTDTFLRNLDLGGGVTALGKQNISTGGTVDSPAYSLWNVLSTYKTKLFGVGTTFQLNVDNLFGNKDLIFTGYNTIGTVTQASNYYFLPPRKVTARIAFAF